MHPPNFISSLPNCHVLISELPNDPRSVSQGKHHPKRKAPYNQVPYCLVLLLEERLIILAPE